MATMEATTAPAIEYITRKRRVISDALERIARERGRILEAGLPGGVDLMERVLEYSRRGKMLRGALVHLGAELFVCEQDLRGSCAEEAAVDAIPISGVDEAAASMEFFQAGLLVHDDIMDRDETRRGAPSFHSRYTLEARDGGAADPSHLGDSLGICAGDVCLFEGFSALARARARVEAAGLAGCSGILALAAGELSGVGLAQMRDCRWSALPEEPGTEEILAMYRGKTARYTFSLPLAVGALLAGRPDAQGILIEIGELAGIAFQIRDDELGLYGEEAVTGKSTTSDIREGKKTIYRARLMAEAPAADRERLGTIYGSSSAGPAEAAFVRDGIERLGIRDSIATLRDELARRAKSLLATIPDAREEARDTLADLIDWSITRKS
jgi:geranylgeranyl diphosphate synthase type I